MLELRDTILDHRSSKLSSTEVRVECIEYRVECFEFRDKKQRTFHVISFSHILSESGQFHFDLLHFTGQDFTAAQRERAQEDFKVLFKGAPPHPPPIRIRKTATAPGSPYSFRIVRGFFYVPQNYQHSRNCETYRPYPRRLESLTICR